jgi:hypothetical protein
LAITGVIVNDPSLAADEGLPLIANSDTLAEYAVCANPPVDTATIVPDLIAVTSDCLDEVKILIPADLA